MRSALRTRSIFSLTQKINLYSGLRKVWSLNFGVIFSWKCELCDWQFLNSDYNELCRSFQFQKISLTEFQKPVNSRHKKKRFFYFDINNDDKMKVSNFPQSFGTTFITTKFFFRKKSISICIQGPKVGSLTENAIIT